jgi:hypothetical protein
VTIDELRIECMFPADEATAEQGRTYQQQDYRVPPGRAAG